MSSVFLLNNNNFQVQSKIVFPILRNNSPLSPFWDKSLMWVISTEKSLTKTKE